MQQRYQRCILSGCLLGNHRVRISFQSGRNSGLSPAKLVGIDLKIHDEPENYQRVVRFLKNDPLSLGALITTHKMDLMRACQDEFDAIDPLASELGEVSSIYKRNSKLMARATDPRVWKRR